MLEFHHVAMTLYDRTFPNLVNVDYVFYAHYASHKAEIKKMCFDVNE